MPSVKCFVLCGQNARRLFFRVNNKMLHFQNGNNLLKVFLANATTNLFLALSTKKKLSITTTNGRQKKQTLSYGVDFQKADTMQQLKQKNVVTSIIGKTLIE